MPDYTLGSGRVLFKKTALIDYLDLGNAPNFSLTMTVEDLDHFNSQSGVRTKDAKVVLQQEINAAFTLDEPNISNLELFFMTGANSSATQSTTPIVDESWAAKLDRWHKLTKVDVSAVVVTGPGATPTYVLTTDYKVLLAGGYVMPLSSGSISADEAIEVDFTPAATVEKTINLATSTTVEGEMRFVGDPAAGRIIDVRAKVSILPEGEMGLIGEEWVEFGFTAEFLIDATISTGLGLLVDRGLKVAA